MKAGERAFGPTGVVKRPGAGRGPRRVGRRRISLGGSWAGFPRTILKGGHVGRCVKESGGKKIGVPGKRLIDTRRKGR